MNNTKISQKIITLIRLFRLQSSFAINLFIFIPLLLYGNFKMALYNTMPFFLMISGTIALNDCCDIKKDSVNKPHRPLVSNTIKVSTAFISVTVVLSVSLFMAVLTYRGHCDRLVIFLTVFTFLSLYNLPLKIIPIIKSLITAFCTVVSLLFVYTFIPVESKEVYFLTAVFFFIMSRELLMDVRDMEGDKNVNYKTAALIWGEKKTIIAALLFLLIANFSCGLYSIFDYSMPKIILLCSMILTEIYTIMIFVTSRNRTVRNKCALALWIPIILALFITRIL